MSRKINMKRRAYSNDDRDAEINADYSIPVGVDTTLLNWERSPSPGVLRKRLELVGKRNPRLTTLVKFAPGSSFSRHWHDGGEEFFVLSGVFSDASGDYGPGSYNRNPPGTYHAPYTERGCTILVKLREFQSLDHKQTVVDTHAKKTRWSFASEPGVSLWQLHSFSDEAVRLYRIKPQCWTIFKKQSQIIEIYIFKGSISVGKNQYQKGTWLRYPAGIRVKVSAPSGASFYMKKKRFEKV